MRKRSEKVNFFGWKNPGNSEKQMNFAPMKCYSNSFLDKKRMILILEKCGPRPPFIIHHSARYFFNFAPRNPFSTIFSILR
jgi:hypothetical protein